jgi:hypothetical protein
VGQVQRRTALHEPRAGRVADAAGRPPHRRV